MLFYPISTQPLSYHEPYSKHLYREQVRSKAISVLSEELLHNDESACWVAPEFYPNLIRQEFEGLLKAEKPLEQSYFYLEPQSALLWYEIAEQQARLAEIPFHRITDAIFWGLRENFNNASQRGVKIIALGPGTAHKELTIAQKLLTKLDYLHLYFLDVNAALLGLAYQSALELLADQSGTFVSSIQGNMHQLPYYNQLTYTPQDTHRPKLVTLLGGTFGHLNNERTFIKESLKPFNKGDLLLIDGEAAHGPVHQEAWLSQSDLWLSGRVDVQLRSAYEDFLKEPLRQYFNVADIEFKLKATTKECQIPDSYSIELEAHFSTELKKHHQLPMFHFKKFNPNSLVKCLEQEQWVYLDGWRFGSEQEQFMYLFKKI